MNSKLGAKIEGGGPLDQVLQGTMNWCATTDRRWIRGSKLDSSMNSTKFRFAWYLAFSLVFFTTNFHLYRSAHPSFCAYAHSHCCTHPHTGKVSVRADHLCTVTGHGKRSKTTYLISLPTGSEESEVLGVGNNPVAILPSCQDMKTIAL